MLADVFHMGNWVTVKEMEEVLTIEELQLLTEALHRGEHRRNKFAAALKGIDLDEGVEDNRFEEIKKRANAELSGTSEEQYTFGMIGIEMEEDD